MIIYNLQKWWFDDGLRLKTVYVYIFSYDFPSFLRFSLINMNIQF